MLHPLQALSPIDGRYQEKTQCLSPYISESALMKYRLHIEIEWLIFLSRQEEINNIFSFTPTQEKHLRDLVENFTLEEAKMIKHIEKTTQHDVKALEYYIKEKLQQHTDFSSCLSFIHFACTSEDINNIAYSCMLRDLRKNILNPSIENLINELIQRAHRYAAIPMLARTHGQPATPTTLGKELANIAARLRHQHTLLKKVNITAKINGATGNFNAHISAFPTLDWLTLSEKFIQQFGLTPCLYTTQIEPHDTIAEYAHALSRINTILIDFSRDMWGYISLNYFQQIKKEGQVGSSTMPHKINPIDFENAEGNLHIANALFHLFAEKLPISRFQRDLSDSTVLRNLGVSISHSYLAYLSLQTGIQKLTANEKSIADDLNQHWEILAEPIQTILRKYKISDAYEKLKTFSQGQAITEKDIHAFIQELNLNDNISKELMKLTPSQYIGLATLLALKIE